MLVSHMKIFFLSFQTILNDSAIEQPYLPIDSGNLIRSLVFFTASLKPNYMLWVLLSFKSEYILFL
jgi:hypothetical protein